MSTHCLDYTICQNIIIPPGVQSIPYKCIAGAISPLIIIITGNSIIANNAFTDYNGQIKLIYFGVRIQNDFSYSSELSIYVCPKYQSKRFLNVPVIIDPTSPCIFVECHTVNNKNCNIFNLSPIYFFIFIIVE